ncbi:MAG: hypothetical protein KGL38_13795 [Gemmatimonadota bacterium]|nr:hypothetical protein [Gemmatimonadota bacterium]MDE3174052.1 hypothetical protein [Gemmatimonadota bacterium]
MTLRDFLSPNPRLTRQEYELAQAMGRKRYAVRGGLRMARWLLTLSVVILVGRGYLAGDWARLLNLRVALEVALLVALCSLFVAYTTYALVWKALCRMFGPTPGG